MSADPENTREQRRNTRMMVAAWRLANWLRGRCTTVGGHRRRDTGEYISVVCERRQHPMWGFHEWGGDRW